MDRRLFWILTVGILAYAGFLQIKPMWNRATTTRILNHGNLQTVTITVDHGYSPDHIIAEPGIPIQLIFDRQERMESCAQDVRVEPLKKPIHLPNHTQTRVTLPPQDPGTLAFYCTMQMMKGQIDILN